MFRSEEDPHKIRDFSEDPERAWLSALLIPSQDCIDVYCFGPWAIGLSRRNVQLVLQDMNVG